MKIVFFARRFYPAIGGVEKHVMSLSQELIKKGHTIIVIAEKTPEDSSQKFTHNNIQIYKIKAGKDDWFKKFRIWRELWKLKKIILQSDVVHCHDVFFWYLPFRFVFPAKQVFMTFHGYEGYPITRKAIFVRKISEKLTWGNICIGDFITKWYGTRADYISYGAVKSNQYLENKKKIKNRSAIFIGRLEKTNSIDIYAEAIKKLLSVYKDFAFCVVGDGTYKSLFNENVKMMGYDPSPEKYIVHYHFAFVSGYLSILEAFAARRLVFAVYDNPLKKDYLQMTPYADWIVIAKDAEELAQKVVYYLEHPEKEEEMVDRAYNWVTKQTWEKMGKLYLDLWSK